MPLLRLFAISGPARYARSVDFSTVTLLVGMAALGFRHGFDWDHIAAITDITSTTTAGHTDVDIPIGSAMTAHGHEPMELALHAHDHARAPSAVHSFAESRFAHEQRHAVGLASLYALGHASVVVVLGVIALLLGAVLPEWVDPILQRVVGVTLVLLGAWVIYSVVQFARGKGEFRMRSRWMLVFDLARNATEARRADKLRGIYHRGQETAWDGRQVLPEILRKHGGVHCPPQIRDAIGRIFSVILWGELAAWKVSAQLAVDIEELEPKMAATSQAFDEARHFYVMHDYLAALGFPPQPMGRAQEAFLELVLRQDDVTLKLVGMQLMVETTALTIFQMVRETGCEPVLCELLPYYERDEARHVGLGVQFLPSRLRGIGLAGLSRMTAYEVQLVYWELTALAEMEPHLRALGIRAQDLVRIGFRKQMQANDMMWDAFGRPDRPVGDLVSRLISTAAEARFPPDHARRSVLGRARAAAKVWRAGGYHGQDGRDGGLVVAA